MGLTASSSFSCIVAIDRFAAVKNFDKIYKFIKKQTRVIIVIIVICSSALHIPRFFEFYPDQKEIELMLNNSQKTGARLTRLYKIEQYRVATFFINSTFTTIVPFLIMSIFGGFLIGSFILLHKSHTHLDQTGRISRGHREKISLATQLVLLSIGLFTITGIFSLIMISVAIFDPTFITQGSSHPILNYIRHLNNFLISLRSSINFLIYCATCSQYRAHIKKMFCGARSTTIDVNTPEAKRRYYSKISCDVCTFQQNQQKNTLGPGTSVNENDHDISAQKVFPPSEESQHFNGLYRKDRLLKKELEKRKNLANDAIEEVDSEAIVRENEQNIPLKIL